MTHLKSVTQLNRYCLLKVGLRDLRVYNPNIYKVENSVLGSWAPGFPMFTLSSAITAKNRAQIYNWIQNDEK